MLCGQLAQLRVIMDFRTQRDVGTLDKLRLVRAIDIERRPVDHGFYGSECFVCVKTWQLGSSGLD